MHTKYPDYTREATERFFNILKITYKRADLDKVLYSTTTLNPEKKLVIGLLNEI